MIRSITKIGPNVFVWQASCICESRCDNSKFQVWFFQTLKRVQRQCRSARHSWIRDYRTRPASVKQDTNRAWSSVSSRIQTEHDLSITTNICCAAIRRVMLAADKHRSAGHMRVKQTSSLCVHLCTLTSSCPRSKLHAQCSVSKSSEEYDSLENRALLIKYKSVCGVTSVACLTRVSVCSHSLSLSGDNGIWAQVARHVTHHALLLGRTVLTGHDIQCE